MNLAIWKRFPDAKGEEIYGEEKRLKYSVRIRNIFTRQITTEICLQKGFPIYSRLVPIYDEYNTIFVRWSTEISYENDAFPPQMTGDL